MILQTQAMRVAALGLAALLAVGCASLPPGADYPKAASNALAHPEETKLGRHFEATAREHGGDSGFRILTAGVAGFLARAEMLNAAERTIDLEYFIFRQDETGRLLTDALLRAADRGVRVRLLVDDGDTVDGDEEIAALSAHPKIEVRIFNPFVYRGHVLFIRAVEFGLTAARLDYRMHNKLLVVDNAIALVGGRNIGDQYFQVDQQAQLGDDDVFTTGPIVKQLSVTFDEFWNCALAIPTAALANGTPSHFDLDAYRKALDEHRQQVKRDGTDYASRVETGEPLAGIIAGTRPLAWAPVQLVYDSPHKKKVRSGEMVGELMHKPVGDAMAAVQSELLIITPYLIPGKGGTRILSDLRKRGVRVSILTNSLESTPELMAHAGYMHYRIPLLEDGVELYEVRALLGDARGTGESIATARSTSYSLHAKLFVLDRRKLYVGSMNFDERSHRLNTEIGLLIDSPELAQETAVRFAAIVSPANSYRVVLTDASSGSPKVVWRTEERGAAIEYDTEPARSDGERLKVHLLSLLPLDKEL
jgi:putative cardiolipin synthase